MSTTKLFTLDKKISDKAPSTKKKKHCRIRNRIRNKHNRQNEKIIPLDLDSNIKNEGVNIKDFEAQNQTMSTKATEKLNFSTATSEAEKPREQVKAEREAKKLAKQAKKNKNLTNVNLGAAQNSSNDEDQKIKREIKVEQESNKQIEKNSSIDIDVSVKKVTHENGHAVIDSSNEKKKSVLTKADRRAIQEMQRANKAQVQTNNKSSSSSKNTESKAVLGDTTLLIKSNDLKLSSPLKGVIGSAKNKEYNVKLFNHLESSQRGVSLFVNNAQIHPIIVRLGEQYNKRTVVGSNARCIAFLNALKMVIQDFETPPKKEFARSLESTVKTSVTHLQKCRPLAVSVNNAYKHIKHVLTQLPTDRPESELKENLCHFIDTYIENQIGKAAQAISSSMQEKINDGDVILTFGCSSLINYIFEEAHSRNVDFRVIVVDSRPFCEGQELLRRLVAKEIPCTYVLINAVGFVMPEVTKILLGAHALLSNGYVMARTGTAQVALIANSFNVPVLVCCETHKFSERFQTDAIVYNELGDPHDLVISEKCSLTNWQSKSKMSPLNLMYDITPPELVTAVVTEVSILPCTSVPVILRIKPTEIGYYS